MLSSIAQNKALTAMVVFFLPLTLSLGFWQLDRATEKKSLSSAMAQTDQIKALDIGDDLLALPNFQHVSLQGRLRPQSIWLLDNQIWQGQTGVDVIVPIMFGDRQLLVNLGWLVWPDRSTLPNITLPDTHLQLTGRLVFPGQDRFVLAEDTKQATSPRLIQRIDMQAIETDLGSKIWPQMLYLNERSDGVLVSHWRPVNMGPEKHYGYAVQWFGLAIVLLVLYAYRIYQFGRKRQ